jgi:GDSL-like Lipase/Acylhydrolase family
LIRHKNPNARQTTKMKITLITVTVLSGLILFGFGETKPNRSKKPVRSAAKNPAFAPVVDDPKLPRVLLIGDSISIGYTVPVQKLLKGKANVHRIPTNVGPTINGLAHLKEWLGDGKWDVIHFNWGLHDLKFMPDGKRQVDLKDYEKNLRELVRRLQAIGAKLIWATTTPVPEGVNPPRKDADVVAYNAVALKIMEENKIAVDDLYSYALPKLEEIQLPANVHYTREGYGVLAKRVAASIESALAAKK